jgi:uncharacterized protein involved in outer membrane biogenesis
MHNRTLVVLLLAILAVFGLAVTLVDFDAPALGEMVLESARESTGLDLRSARSRINLFRGLTLEDVRLSAELGFGAYEVHVERLRFEHRPFSLLRGRFVLSRVVIERPAIRIRLGRPPDEVEGAARAPRPKDQRSRGTEPEGAPRSEPAEESRSTVWTVELTPSEVRIEGGDVVFRDRDGASGPFSLEDLDLGLRRLAVERRAITLLHGITALGDLRLGDLGLRGFDVRNVSAELEIDRGRIRLDPLRFVTERGELEGSASFDFNSLPFRYRLSVSAGSFEAPVVGRGSLRIDAEGFGSDSRHLSGEGAFRLERGTLPDSKLLLDVDPALSGAEHGPGEISFRVANDRLLVGGFSLDLPGSSLALDGFAELGGALHFVLTVGREGAVTKVFLEGTAQAPAVSRRRDR